LLGHVLDEGRAVVQAVGAEADYQRAQFAHQVGDGVLVTGHRGRDQAVDPTPDRLALRVATGPRLARMAVMTRHGGLASPVPTTEMVTGGDGRLTPTS
jgi:hypothetical protein